MAGKVKKIDFTRKGKWLTILFLAFLVYFCVIIVNQQLSLRNLNRRQNEIEADIEKYTLENDALKEQVELVRTNKYYIEGIARNELGLVRDGEIIYVLPID